jgi:hypothetical protein
MSNQPFHGDVHPADAAGTLNRGHGPWGIVAGLAERTDADSRGRFRAISRALRAAIAHNQERVAAIARMSTAKGVT